MINGSAVMPCSLDNRPNNVKISSIGRLIGLLTVRRMLKMINVNKADSNSALPTILATYKRKIEK